MRIELILSSDDIGDWVDINFPVAIYYNSDWDRPTIHFETSKMKSSVPVTSIKNLRNLKHIRFVHDSEIEMRRKQEEVFIFSKGIKF